MINVLTALTTLKDMLALTTLIAGETKKIGDLLAKAQAENRDITVQELSQLRSLDDLAKQALDDAIAKDQ